MAIDLIRQFVEISLDMAKPVEEKAVSMRIADTIAYLEQQIFSKFPGIEALSSRAGLCATHFKSAFKSQTGQSPFAFFRQRQMEFAINALKSGQYNVKEIALLLQFDNPSNFTWSFRQFNGVAPSHFAASNGINDAQ
jgi:AraC-type DNA-binding domain-containing proteins